MLYFGIIISVMTMGVTNGAPMFNAATKTDLEQLESIFVRTSVLDDIFDGLVT